MRDAIAYREQFEWDVTQRLLRMLPRVHLAFLWGAVAQAALAKEIARLSAVLDEVSQALAADHGGPFRHPLALIAYDLWRDRNHQVAAVDFHRARADEAERRLAGAYRA